MIYKVLLGLDAGGKTIWEWRCDCEHCLATTNIKCGAVVQANIEEENKSQDTALYASLRR